jgi:hypothetical protein
VVVLAGAGDEGVDDAAVNFDRRDCDGAALVFECAGCLGALCTVANRFVVGCGRVLDSERDFFDPVAVEFQFLGGGVVLGERSGEEDSDVSLREEVVRFIA